jgi:sulfite reductase alpha subunit-like flavoprotein
MAKIENIIQEKDLLNDERISRYMQGKMNADEESSFMEELKNNDNLRNQAIAQARLVKGMKQVDEELKDAFREADEQTIRRIAKEAIGNKKHSARWLAIAASIVFIVFVGFKSYDYYDTTSLGREYANTFPTSTIIRGEANTDVDTELTMLFNNVAEGKDLDNTTSRLATLWELSKQDTYNDYTDYAPYIGWNLAIGYLRNYEKAMARNVLSEMETIYDNETIIGIKVRDLIKAIE